MSPLYTLAFQANQKPNILFEGLKPKSASESAYVASLESQVRVSLVNCNRLNVITRDSTYWRNVKRELALKDFTDETSALKLGKLSGASHYLEGLLIRYVTGHKSESQSDGTVKVSYSASAEISLSLINLNSGRQETSFAIEKTVWAREPGEARAMCFSAVADEVKTKFVHYFPITTTIATVNAGYSEATINDGANGGIILQSIYALSTDRSVVVRVVDLGPDAASVRLVSGDISKLQPGSILNESFESTKSAVRVVSVSKEFAYIDGGNNLAIKTGDVFVVSKRKLIAETPTPIYDESFPSAVIITDVKPDFAKARIIKGFDGVQKDTELVFSDNNSFIRKNFVFAGYKVGLTPKIKANSNHGLVAVSNDAGEFQVQTSYNNNYKDITSIGIITLGFGTHNLASRLSTTFNADIYNIGEGTMKNWIAHLDVVHEGLVKEDRFYFFYGAGAGFGNLKQRIPGNVLQNISAGRSSTVRDGSFYATGKIGARLMVWRFGLSVTASYDFMKYKAWTYSAGDDSDIVIQNEILPYPVVNLSGAYVSSTLSYSLN